MLKRCFDRNKHLMLMSMAFSLCLLLRSPSPHYKTIAFTFVNDPNKIIKENRSNRNWWYKFKYVYYFYVHHHQINLLNFVNPMTWHPKTCSGKSICPKKNCTLREISSQWKQKPVKKQWKRWQRLIKLYKYLLLKVEFW